MSAANDSTVGELLLTQALRGRAKIAGMPENALQALEFMQPRIRYRFDQNFPCPKGASELVTRGFAEDISSGFPADVRGAILNHCGEVLQAVIFG